MYSPIKDTNNNVRINPNKNKYIIRGRRKLKIYKETDKSNNYESSVDSK
jgi:hypothetical protein